ncbi:hypothetical protein [Flavobacterium adhaerens]|uniref:hypothetical protein n=1 Tax=Flavobacterium adhaerens TaxID=3149043 RepID=UPI0032B387A0
MSKFIFILFLFLCSLNSFAQKHSLKKKTIKSVITNKLLDNKTIEKDDYNETEIELLLNNNLCEILSIRPSDLLNEEMLKKLRANV